MRVIFWLCAFVLASFLYLGATVFYVATCQSGEPPAVIFRYDRCTPIVEGCPENGLMDPRPYLLVPDMDGNGEITPDDLALLILAIQQFRGDLKPL